MVNFMSWFAESLAQEDGHNSAVENIMPVNGYVFLLLVMYAVRARFSIFSGLRLTHRSVLTNHGHLSHLSADTHIALFLPRRLTICKDNCVQGMKYQHQGYKSTKGTCSAAHMGNIVPIHKESCMGLPCLLVNTTKHLEVPFPCHWYRGHL